MSAPMVRAILNGTKRQTRRIVNPQPKGELTGYGCKGGFGFGFFFGQENFIPDKWQDGDRLTVKESAWMWCEKRPNGTTPKGRPKWLYAPMPNAPVYYTADHPKKPTLAVVSPTTGNEWGWRLKIGRYLPAWASCLTLELTRVRIERLHDITEADAWAEGIGREGRPLEALVNVCMAFPKLNIGALAADDPKLFTFGDDRGTPTDYERVVATTGRGVYAALWEGINGPGSWAANPWVWALDFRRVQP